MKWILFFLAILATASLACGSETEIASSPPPPPENRTVIEDDGSVSGAQEVSEEVAPFASVTMQEVQSLQTVFDRIGWAQAGFTINGDYLIHTAVNRGESDDYLIEFWDTSTWKLDEIITRPGSGEILNLEFDPNGRYFMISDENDFIRLIDPNTRREIARFDDEEVTGVSKNNLNSFVGASIAQGGNTIIEATADNIFIWDVASGTIIRTFEEIAVDIFDVASFGDYAVWSTKEGGLQVYNLADQELLELVSCRYGEGLSISANGRYVACVSFYSEDSVNVENTLKVWRLPDMKLVLEQTEGIYGEPVTVFSPDEKLILVGGDDYDSNLIAIYIPTNEVVFREQFGGRETPRDIKFSPDGEFIIAALESQETRIWSIEGDWGKEVDTESEELACVDTQYNELLVSIESNDWEAAAVSLAPLLEYHSEYEDVEQLAESPQMQEALKEIYLSLWESQGNVSKYSEAAVPGDLNTAWGLSSNWLIAGVSNPWGQDISIISLNDMQSKGVISFYNNGETVKRPWAVFSEDEQLLAINDRFDVHIIDMNTLNPIRVIERSSDGFGCWGLTCEIRALDFSRDGSLVAIGGRYGYVEIWDVASGTMIGVIDNVRATDDHHVIREVKFTPDNEYVLVSKEAGYTDEDDFYVFRVTPNGFGEQVFSLNIDTGSAGGISFSPDGETFYFTESWEVWVWDTDGWYDRTLYRDEALMNSDSPYLLDVGPIIFAVGEYGGVSVRKTGSWEGYELDIQSDRSDVRLLAVSEDYRDLWKAGEIITHWRVKPARVCD